MKRILAVDDNLMNLTIVKNTLQSRYEVICMESGMKALEYLGEHRVDLVLLDMVMPVMNGMEVMECLKSVPSTRNIPVIFLTSERTVDMEIRCLENGAIDFIGKPFAPATLTARVERTLELEGYRHMLEDKVEEKIETIRRIQRNIVINLAEVIESRDIDSGQHVKRTSAYVETLSNCLAEVGLYQKELTKEYIGVLVDVAVLHDIGKITIPDHILCKPAKLTDEEYHEIKKHTIAGGRLVWECLHGVTDEKYLRMARELAMYHHERWDGGGYPKGMKREKIPLGARIMAIADVFDALVSKRCYKEAFDLDATFQIIKEGRGKQFDPLITDVFLVNRQRFVNIFSENLDCGQVI